MGILLSGGGGCVVLRGEELRREDDLNVGKPRVLATVVINQKRKI